MGAPKRTQLQTTMWLRPRTTSDPPASFRHKVLGYPGAKVAFDKLIGGGFDADLPMEPWFTIHLEPGPMQTGYHSHRAAVLGLMRYGSCHATLRFCCCGGLTPSVRYAKLAS